MTLGSGGTRHIQEKALFFRRHHSCRYFQITMATARSTSPIYHSSFKEGSGDYEGVITKQIIEKAANLVQFALKKITDNKKSLYTICDYGTADGGGSMNTIRQCIAHLKADDPNVEVQVWYEDRPENDFKSLFYRLHGILPEPPTYLKDFQGVYVGAIGTGFYQQCVPSKSVDLAISSTAVHWLSKRPCNLKNSIVHILDADETEQKLFKEQGASDWMTFLNHRSHELVPGGQAVVIMQLVNDQFRRDYSHWSLLCKTWRTMAKEGMITQEEFVNTNICFYERTKEEIAAPFKDENSPVWKAGLRLVSLETRPVTLPSYQDWISSGKPDNINTRQEYGKTYTGPLKNWGKSFYLHSLSDLRSEEEKKKITDELFTRVEQQVTACPQDYVFGVYCAYLHFMKLY